MNKFGRRKIALALACALVLGDKTQAMNTNKNKKPQTLGAVGGDVSHDRNLENKIIACFDSKAKIPAPPINLPKNLKPLYYTLAALGISITVVLIILGVKFFGKKSDDQKQNTKGEVYYGLGKFKSIEDLKDAWEENFGDYNKPASSFVDYLIKIDEKYTEEFKKEINKEVTTELIESGDSGAKIYFNGDNFDCYNNLDKKLNLTDYEREIISGIAELFKDRLGIRPCSVKRSPRSFYFDFHASENISTLVTTVCKDLESWFCDFGLRN